MPARPRFICRGNSPPACAVNVADSRSRARKNPSFSWLYAANERDLATRDSVACWRLVKSEWYRERWGDGFALTTDQNVKTWYENDRRGIGTSPSCRIDPVPLWRGTTWDKLLMLPF